MIDHSVTINYFYSIPVELKWNEQPTGQTCFMFWVLVLRGGASVLGSGMKISNLAALNKIGRSLW